MLLPLGTNNKYMALLKILSQRIPAPMKMTQTNVTQDVKLFRCPHQMQAGSMLGCISRNRARRWREVIVPF